MESQSLSQSCHYLLNNHPDEVNSKAVLPIAWLIKLNILLGSDYLSNTCIDLHYIPDWLKMGDSEATTMTDEAHFSNDASS